MYDKINKTITLEGKMRSLFIALLLVPALALATKGPFEPHYKDILSKGIMSLPSKGLMVGNANGKVCKNL